MDLPNFWDQTHPLTKTAETLFEKLVPTMGSCETLQGELVRASSRISYDWYNNGWGCNNWSGAVVFLRRYIKDLPIQDQMSQAFFKELDKVHQFSHGESPDIHDTEADRLVTAIHEYVVKAVLDNPTPVPNSVDMFSLNEPNAPYEDEEDDYWEDSDN